MKKLFQVPNARQKHRSFRNGCGGKKDGCTVVITLPFGGTAIVRKEQKQGYNTVTR